MQSSRSLWPVWARFLQQWGLKRIAAQILDTTGPLSIFGAQIIYLGQPFLDLVLPSGHIQVLAQLFEDQAELKQFTAYLREEKPL